MREQLRQLNDVNFNLKNAIDKKDRDKKEQVDVEIQRLRSQLKFKDNDVIHLRKKVSTLESEMKQTKKIISNNVSDLEEENLVSNKVYSLDNPLHYDGMVTAEVISQFSSVKSNNLSLQVQPLVSFPISAQSNKQYLNTASHTNLFATGNICEVLTNNGSESLHDVKIVKNTDLGNFVHIIVYGVIIDSCICKR